MSTRRRHWLAALPAIAIVAACSSGDDLGTAPVTTVAPSANPGSTATTLTTAVATTVAPAATTVPAAAASTAPPTAPAPTTTTAPPDVTDVTGAQVALTEIAVMDEPIALGVRTGDTGLYVAERGGRLRIIRDGQLAPDPVLDFSDLVLPGGERGFLGFAYSPTGDRLYVNYTDVDGNDRLDEYTVAADGAVDANSRREILFQPDSFPNHNGGQVVFGPDGYLYTSFGDGGSANDPERNGLDLGTWLGKILRIDPTPSGDQPWTAPPDNPFVDQDGALPEIWSFGLRNPWRFSFDPVTGDLWIGDVGQGALEEVDWAPAREGGGAGRATNFGWSAFEGTERANDDQDAPDHTPPVYEYTHDDNNCSITGGFRYRGAALPHLYGAYIFADYCVAGIRAIALNGGEATDAVEISPDPESIVSFGEGTDHELYVLSFDGTVRRLDPPG